MCIRDRITTMLFAGLCAAIAGIMITAKLKSGIPTVGDAVTLQVIAACALGGTALAGGKGNILFALLGCAIVVVDVYKRQRQGDCHCA